MILVSGFNVYPNEIEDVVMQHSGVLEVAAIGVPSGSSGGSGEDFRSQERCCVNRRGADYVLPSPFDRIQGAEAGGIP